MPCYKLNFDKSKINLSKFLDTISDYGDIVLYENHIYIWLDINITKEQFVKVFKKMKIQEIYCEHFMINLNECSIYDTNHLTVWWAEHYNKTVQQLIENNCQDMLMKIQDNIRQASNMLDVKIKEANN